jgi:DNA-binding transcriptional ArsR family regulator
MLTGYRLAEKTESLAKKTSGLAHPIRLAILYILTFGPRPMGDMSQTIDVPPNLTVHHLNALCQSGWIRKEKQGRLMMYFLRPTAFNHWMDFFKEGPLLK